jgi:opacity protein-like surface antigen
MSAFAFKTRGYFIPPFPANTLSTIQYARSTHFTFSRVRAGILLSREQNDQSSKIKKIMKTKVFFALTFLAFITLSSVAQESGKRFGFELSSGVSVATSKPGDAEMKTGFGIEGIFHYQFMPFTGVYVGWGWNRFSSENSFAGMNADFEETGYVFGLQFKHPIGNLPISYYVRAAGLYNHIEIENEAGDIINDSGHGMGWQLAGGLDVNLGKNWSLAPGVKYNSLSRDIDFEGVNEQMDFNYLSFRVGILKKF